MIRRRREERPERAEKREYPGFVEDLLNTAIAFLLVSAAAVLILLFIGRAAIVNGDSMQPMLHDGDMLIVQKIAYHHPKRFDIVVFDSLDGRGTLFIKRVIGLPGETIQIQDGEITIDGEILEEDYGLEPIKNAGIASDPISLGEEEYFVLGDNRNNSGDSRSVSVGAVKQEQIEGKALFRFWPLGDSGLLKHQ
ncbi:signal peptidase I [Hominifimenecus sp. rT4P-3]|uniref:signal peptidase I n=1 Tax=Hominifimenecus sp. rT4P-3 TaxID=3242979 RepID=UPI003DA1EBAF